MFVDFRNPIWVSLLLFLTFSVLETHVHAAFLNPLNDENFFPIGVWLQPPSDAAAYKQYGINTFVGLWAGPTTAQLDALRAAGIWAIGSQTQDARLDVARGDDSVVIAYSHQDEPDNAQWNGAGYDPCVSPAELVAEAAAMRAADNSRPIYLNFGRGVAVTGWFGRGTCTGDTDYYKDAHEAADIISFDVYPVNSAEAEVREKLHYVADGVENLLEWSGRSKPVWLYIETTWIGEDNGRTPTPAQTISEIWLAIVRGATGILYFCHSWQGGSVNENAFLESGTMIESVAVVNAQLTALAAVLNSATVANVVTVESSNAAVPIDVMMKRTVCGTAHVFAVTTREGQTSGTFRFPAGAVVPSSTVQVLHEARSLTAAADGSFVDSFGDAKDYDHHVYVVEMVCNGEVSSTGSVEATASAASSAAQSTTSAAGGTNAATNAATTTVAGSGGFSSSAAGILDETSGEVSAPSMPIWQIALIGIGIGLLLFIPILILLFWMRSRQDNGSSSRRASYALASARRSRPYDDYNRRTSSTDSAQRRSRGHGSVSLGASAHMRRHSGNVHHAPSTQWLARPMPPRPPTRPVPY